MSKRRIFYTFYCYMCIILISCVEKRGKKTKVVNKLFFPDCDFSFSMMVVGEWVNLVHKSGMSNCWWQVPKIVGKSNQRRRENELFHEIKDLFTSHKIYIILKTKA